jgi:hypothetical protein
VTSAVVVIPGTATRQPMGADYIGKDLITRQYWDTSTLSWRDWLMWLYRDESLIKPQPSEQIMLWVRKDVYGVETITED